MVDLMIMRTEEQKNKKQTKAIFYVLHTIPPERECYKMNMLVGHMISNL